MGCQKSFANVEEVQALTDGEMRIESSIVVNDWEDAKNMEIWENNMSMLVLNGSQLLIECEEAKRARVRKRILHYYWNNDNLMFKDLVVFRPNEHR
jgi:hypothetical protein